MTEPHPTIAQLQRVIAECQRQITQLQQRLAALERQREQALDVPTLAAQQRARLHEPARECRGCGAGRGCACE